MDIGWHGLALVGTSASAKEGAASDKEIPVGKWSVEVRVGGSAVNELNGHGLDRFARGREARAVPGWSGRYSWGAVGP